MHKTQIEAQTKKETEFECHSFVLLSQQQVSLLFFKQKKTANGE
jgi:hypothetical protein